MTAARGHLGGGLLGAEEGEAGAVGVALGLGDAGPGEFERLPGVVGEVVGRGGRLDGDGVRRVGRLLLAGAGGEGQGGGGEEREDQAESNAWVSSLVSRPRAAVG